MVHIRKGMVMRLEKALAKDKLTQREINEACRGIFDFVSDLRFSISGLHALIVQLGEADAVKIPSSLGILLAETDACSDEIIAELGYDEETRDNKTDIFSDPDKRSRLYDLCTEMNRMIDVLCGMLSASNEAAPARGTTKAVPAVSRKPRTSLVHGSIGLPHVIALFPDLESFREKVNAMGL